MPTPTMPDEDLDALFRRGAQAYPDEVLPPAAWERMERQLDAAAATQRLRRQVGRIFAVELLVWLLLGWQGYRYVQRPAEVAARLSAAAQGEARSLADSPQAAGRISSSRTDPTTAHATAAAVAAPTPSAHAGVAAALPSTALRSTPTAANTAAGSTATVERKHSTATVESEYFTNSELITKKAKGARLPAASRRPAHRAGKPVAERPSTKQIPLAGRTFTGRTLARRPLTSAGTAPTTAPSAAATEQAAAASATQPELLAYALPRLLPVAPYPLPDSLAKLATVTLPTDSAATTKRPTPRPAYRLVLGVLGAPSFSGVRTAQSAQLGGDYGLTLDYRFAPRLRVRVGVISSQKRYQAASTDYQAPAAWHWYGGNYTLDASCRVTQIPLDLRYDVLRRPTYTVFSSLGVNSLLMRNERYSYDWTMNGQTYTKTAQVVDGSNHFLSVLNVSVGLERALGARWAAQVEPYWQFPLGGVGAGQVRLSSAGAAFSLKYGLFR